MKKGVVYSVRLKFHLDSRDSIIFMRCRIVNAEREEIAAMRRIKIGTDSTADIPKELCQELNISVLPLSLIHEGKEYVEGVDITPEPFYEILETCSQIPTSSQVTSSAYMALYEKTLEEGYTDLIQISVNAKGSGTYQSAVLTKELFYEAHPEARDKLAIHNIDSGTYSMIYGYGVVQAAKMVRDGAEVDTVIEKTKKIIQATRVMLVPMTLRFVKKSGRVSAAAAFVGDAIGLKPVITFEDGESQIVTKIRGEKQAIRGVLDICKKERKEGTPYLIVYGNNPEIYRQMRQACVEELGQEPEIEYPVGCIIAMNTGPNMVAVIYLTEEI